MYSTVILSPFPDHIIQLALLVQQWNIVAFPTETVYGLGADATNANAVQKIYNAKQRPSDNPLIVHVSQPDDISNYAFVRSPLEELIIQKFMPWPLTIILEAKDILCPNVCVSGTVGIRVPAHPVAQSFLKACGLPVAAPSANRSGRPSPTSAEMVLSDMNGLIPYILDGWPSEYGIESTVVKIVNDSVLILRPGFVTQEDIQGVVGDHVPVTFATSYLEQSPWTRYTHYAPDAPVHISQDLQKDIQNYAQSYTNKTIVVIATHETLQDITSDPDWTWHADLYWSCSLLLLRRWSHTDLLACAAKLYQLYHEASQKKADVIFIEHLPEQWLWISIMNRVKKSAQKI